MRKKIFLKGPLLTRSGYGEQSRFALRALRSREDLFDIYIQPLQWGQTSWLNIETEERAWIDQTIEKTIGYIQQGGQFDVSLQITIPNEWEKICPANVGFTAGIETTKVAADWLVKGNEMDRIIVVSSHSKQSFENTGYVATNEQTNEQATIKIETPIKVANYPVKVCDNLPELQMDFDYDFNFLTIAQFSPRKNLLNTIKWFVEEFKDEEVGLVVKTNIAKNSLIDRLKIFNDLKNFVFQLGEHKCKVYLLHGDMSDEEMHSLYRHPKLKGLVALPHGEGFGLPIYEAAYSGMPVVATGWSGQLDFLVDEKGTEHFYNVAFDMHPVQDEVVWDGVLIKESMWAYPREQSAKEKMRDCYNDIVSDNEESFALKSCEYAQEIQDRFSNEKMYKNFVDGVLDCDTANVEAQAEQIVLEFE
jgi:glycosyltransferase involved in cell wall biosynthesis